MSTSAPVSFYLRTDGTILLCQGAAAIEIPLTPDQLLQLAADALNTAIALDPTIRDDIRAGTASADAMPAAALPAVMQ